MAQQTFNAVLIELVEENYFPKDLEELVTGITKVNVKKTFLGLLKPLLIDWYLFHLKKMQKQQVENSNLIFPKIHKMTEEDYPAIYRKHLSPLLVHNLLKDLGLEDDQILAAMVNLINAMSMGYFLSSKNQIEFLKDIAIKMKEWGDITDVYLTYPKKEEEEVGTFPLFNTEKDEIGFSALDCLEENIIKDPG